MDGVVISACFDYSATFSFFKENRSGSFSVLILMGVGEGWGSMVDETIPTLQLVKASKHSVPVHETFHSVFNVYDDTASELKISFFKGAVLFHSHR